jgi:hypothetical protein
MANYHLFKLLYFQKPSKPSLKKRRSFAMDLIKGYKINFSFQSCMYLFINIHSMPLTKPRKGEKKKRKYINTN